MFKIRIFKAKPSMNDQKAVLNFGNLNFELVSDFPKDTGQQTSGNTAGVVDIQISYLILLT